MLPPTFPDLTALELFLDVVRLGSLSQAADRRGVSQPAASKRLQSLERQLGVRLLDRSPTGSRPTANGALIAGWAEGLIQAAEELHAAVEALKARDTGRLRIAASYTVAEYLLPGWLDRFLRDRPSDAVALDVVNSAGVIERLEAGTADLGFIETPGAPRGFRTRTVATDELVAVVAPGHPWARRGRVSLDALAGTPLALREPGSGTREALERALAAKGYGPPLASVEMGSTSAVRGAAIQGASPTVISTLAAAADIQSGRLVPITVDGLEVSRSLRAVWPRGSALAAEAERLLTQIADG